MTDNILVLLGHRRISPQGQRDLEGITRDGSITADRIKKWARSAAKDKTVFEKIAICAYHQSAQVRSAVARVLPQLYAKFPQQVGHRAIEAFYLHDPSVTGSGRIDPPREFADVLVRYEREWRVDFKEHERLGEIIGGVDRFARKSAPKPLETAPREQARKTRLRSFALRLDPKRPEPRKKQLRPYAPRLPRDERASHMANGAHVRGGLVLTGTENWLPNLVRIIPSK